MVYLIGSADTARFSSTYAPTGTDTRGHFNGNDTQGLPAIESGNGQFLDLYISSWGSVANIKATIYKDNAKVESVVVPSSAGTGLISVALAGTTAFSVGSERYRLSIYRDSSNPITYYTDTAGLTLRYDSSGGSYTTPPATLPAGSFDSNNEFYWAIRSASGPTVDTITDPIIGTNPVTIVLSESAPTVDTITFTVGTVTQSQSYTTGDDTTFTISAVTRDLLPPIGTVTVELKAGVSVVASTTSTLQQAAGYSATVGVGVDDSLAVPHTGTLADGDIVLLSDDPNTSIDAAFTDITQTVRTAFTAQVWSAGTETWGDVVIYIDDASGESSVIGSIINSVIIQSIIS